MTKTNNTRPALILNDLTLRCRDAATHIEYARRIGEEWKRDRDYDVMAKRYTYLTRYARINFGAKALPVLRQMSAALDSGRGV